MPIPSPTFQVQYRANPERTLAVMHTGRIAPFVLAIAGTHSKAEALEELALYLERLASAARSAI